MGDAKKKTGEIRGGDVEMCRNLIPTLPDDLAMECLLRVPYQFHSAMKSVCHAWRSLISHPSFYRERRRCGKADPLLCLVQSLVPSTPPATESVVYDGEKKTEDGESVQPRVCDTLRYGLSVYNASANTWHRVALPERIPLFCECVALQDAGKVLLIGGWDPETLQPVRDVFVLDFAGEGSGRRWRRGAPMAVARSFFACAAVGPAKVYVAGGHDDQKNALRSAEMYDVQKDEWRTIPPMEEGRDECHGFTMPGDLGFCVLSGYGTETQGRFRSDAEVYDPASDSWTRIENAWPFPDTSPRGRIVVSGGEIGGRRLRCFTNSDRQNQLRWEAEDNSKKWKLVVETMKLPVAGTSIFAGSMGGCGGERAVVMVGAETKCGGECEGEGAMMMMMTTAEKQGVKCGHVHTPLGFSSQPFSHTTICL
ncbi:PREDICTED: F-box/kelch-repeat protein SKIP20-like [Tarenaya hassleriana]|uniref:F-box/kelch-repeat protein SKIP20-like n=1 Tax=Tarenaya hassleriana TaxID=28532 RepID=UPI00053C22BE|nr:PREDICTED: F-box/kelch-repeat protein SKIP20-like [Tarenaya hassleriana]